MNANRITLWCLIGTAGALPLLAGCAGIVDAEARQLLEQRLGGTTVTVFATFVRKGEDHTYDTASAERFAEFLRRQELADASVSAEQVPITGGWGMNQAKMLRESAAAFAAYLAEHPLETDYALLAEYLFGGKGQVGGIHAYLLDQEGRVAYVVLLNSHHKPFSEANPKTVEDCTEVLIGVLRQELVAKTPD